ncbi:MAG TPA: DMT family transporter [Spirillospora sp.]|nr:DMT family transporter [Spirillospora sp.]
MANAQIATPLAPRTYPYAVLAVGLLTAATGMMCIRMALNSGVPSLVIVATRMGIAVAVFTPFILRSHWHTIRQLRRRDFLLLALAGMFFAGDLTLFSEAINHTSILLATVIGGLAPLWTALLERVVLRSQLHPKVYMGLTLALAGGVTIAIASSDNSAGLGENPLLGALMALCSGASSASYLIVARSLRPRIPLMPYIWLVFGFATLIALVVALATGIPFTGYAPEGYLWILAVTIISQLIAHPSFSFAVGYLSPTFISISAHSITVLASGMAFFLFQEIPGPGQMLGSAIILLGVLFAIVGQSEFKRR